MKLSVTIICVLLALGVLPSEFCSSTLEQINLERQRNGLGGLVADPDLIQISQEWAEKLAGEQRLKHRSRDSLKESLLRFGWKGMDENLHQSISPATPSDVVTSWMHSPVHRENRSELCRGAHV